MFGWQVKGSALAREAVHPGAAPARGSEMLSRVIRRLPGERCYLRLRSRGNEGWHDTTRCLPSQASQAVAGRAAPLLSVKCRQHEIVRDRLRSLPWTDSEVRPLCGDAMQYGHKPRHMAAGPSLTACLSGNKDSAGRAPSLPPALLCPSPLSCSLSPHHTRTHMYMYTQNTPAGWQCHVRPCSTSGGAVAEGS